MSQLFEGNTLNFSQSLFQVDEKLLKRSQMKHTAGPSAANDELGDTHQSTIDMQPVMLNQYRMSAYYQDNPWPTLLYSNQYGLPVMGGNINPNQGSGSRPGNVYKGPINHFKFNEKTNNVVPANVNGIFVPNFAVSGFSKNI